MGPGEMHPRVLREMEAVGPKPLSMIFEKLSQWIEVPVDWKRRNIGPIFLKGRKEDPRNYWPVSLMPCAWNIMEQILLESVLRYMQDREMIWDTSTASPESRPAWTNPVAFCGRLTASVDKGRDVDILDFYKNIILSKLWRDGFRGWTIRQIKKWLYSPIQRVVSQRTSGML